MFNKNFYPTPENVIEMMGIDCLNKVILEPSAGKGNIVEYLNKFGAKEVLTCELDKDLAEIVKTKSRFLKHDFTELTEEEISHINCIVMNPPFIYGSKHVLHAWEIAPPGCEIISLLNSNTLENDYSKERKELLSIIQNYGSKVDLGNVFGDAERTTECGISLVKIYKPGCGANEFEGFFLEEDEETLQENGIMRFDAVKDIVQRYVYAVKCFEEHEKISKRMNELTDKFDVGGFTFSISRDNTVSTKETFKKELQKKAWKYLIDLFNLRKFVTSNVMNDINAFVENQSTVPFTMKNIYRMFEIILGTKEQIFDRSLVETIDRFTRHTDENRYSVEGWKTNEGHMLNKKIIVPYMMEMSFRGDYIRPNHGGYSGYLEDLIKCLCFLNGKSGSEKSLYSFCCDINAKPGEWYSWGFFEFKAFKKGTLHLKFQDENDWALLNRRYAKIKGFGLPEKF